MALDMRRRQIRQLEIRVCDGSWNQPVQLATNLRRVASWTVTYHSLSSICSCPHCRCQHADSRRAPGRGRLRQGCAQEEVKFLLSTGFSVYFRHGVLWISVAPVQSIPFQQPA